MSTHNSKQKIVQVDIIDNKNDDVDHILVRKKIRGLGIFDTSHPEDYVFRRDLEGAIQSIGVTKGQLSSEDPRLEIDWDSSLVPLETITYREKHGDLTGIMLQLLIPNPIIADSYSPSLNWAIVPSLSKLIIDNQGQEAYYVIFGKGIQFEPTPTGDLFNLDGTLNDAGIIVDTEIYNLS